jgi:hypothetical protein
MREEDILLTAVSTPSGVLWEWLAIPQRLKNAPATFNRMVSHVLRPFWSFAPSYFDDIFAHSKAEGDKSANGVHLDHLRRVFEVMREHQVFANLMKCVCFFCAGNGCYVSRNGVQSDPVNQTHGKKATITLVVPAVMMTTVMGGCPSQRKYRVQKDGASRHCRSAKVRNATESRWRSLVEVSNGKDEVSRRNPLSLTWPVRQELEAHRQSWIHK